MVYCDGVHLAADTLDELHSFARSIGLKRRWFQDHPVHPHYDITSPIKLKLAYRSGAKYREPRWLLDLAKKSRKAEPLEVILAGDTPLFPV